MNIKNVYDSKGHIFALCLFAAIAPLVMMTTPVLAYELAVGWKLAPSQVGEFFFYEQIYMGLAAFPAIWWAKRFSPQACMKFFIALFLFGNICSIFADTLTTLILARSGAALAAGSILIITMASASQTSKPARTFAFWLLGQTLLGATAIYFLPELFAKYSLAAFFIVLVALMLIATPFYTQFSREISSLSNANTTTTQPLNTTRYSIIWKSIGVAAVLAFFISISSIWTFLTSIGINSHMTENSVNHYLSLATLFGILGCFVATLIGHKAKRLFTIPLGFLLFFVSITLLFGQVTNINFMSSVFMFKFAWMFTFPFILGSLAAIDTSGSLMKFVSFMIGTGMAIGPVISGWIIENTSGFSSLLSSAFIFFLISLFFMMILNFNVKQSTVTTAKLAIK